MCIRDSFQDKYELIEWIIKTELLEPIKPLLNAGMILKRGAYNLSLIHI